MWLEGVCVSIERTGLALIARMKAYFVGKRRKTA